MTNKMTPMMRQYNNLKQQYKDKILLFRMGDFYETFGEDAKITAKVLNIALTTRDKNDDPTPLAGFPHHAIDQYLHKFVQAGYKVAIADQVEDPSQAKGIVRREVIRVVTPGTVTEDKSLDENQNNFLASVYFSNKVYGIALCDLSTGEFRVTETKDRSRMRDEIARINPSEILIAPHSDFSDLSDYSIQPIEDYSFDEKDAKEILTNHYNIKSLASFGINNYKSAIAAAGAIIFYLEETQKTEVSHLQTIQYYDLNGNMILDSATIRNLDLLYSEGEHGKKSTLISVIDRTKTSHGGRVLRQWILHPLINAIEISDRLNLVDTLFQNPSLLTNVQEILRNISDLERLCGKLGLNRANGRDLNGISESIEHCFELQKALKDEQTFTSLLKEFTKSRHRIIEMKKLIDNSIVKNPPITITEGNIIKEGYSKEVDDIRSKSGGSRKWISELENKERERTGIPSLKVKSNKVFGYYIEVTNTHKDKIPEDYIRKQTLVNCERYITPELKEKEEIVFNAQEKLAELEYECFQEIRTKVLKEIDTIQRISQIIAQIDAISSLAESARVNDYSRPEIFDLGEKDGLIDIKNARHPIVEKTIDEEFISNDITMDSKENRLLILTGPNMSGKSTYIRQTALILLMAQIGSFIPASSARISITDRIFTRVGASDDLSAGRSTFLVEMDEAANIINNATHNSFIVLDEIGRGTSTYDGVSIAWAIAEYIHNSVRARCVFATHYHELLKLESELDGVKNYNIAVLEKDDNITFLRKIEKGGTDKSYGIYVAKMAGLPDSLIQRAKEILNGFEQENMFGVRSEPVRKSKKEKVTEQQPIEDDHQDQLNFMDSSNSIPNLFSDLEDIDINHITPVEALRLLEKWKRRLTRQS
ncbi:DNA mismatch repair protein MutS [Candidatus Dojkabacteria bacterium]|nr:DNA mismatch repair protein MutS [Candidatus Dojkabacteria bacterium]